MAIEILMPALSPTMEEGTLTKWNVKEGDSVQSGDVMAEIETDKATMEFEAVDDGVMGKIIVPEGTQGVKVNDAIAILLEEGETEADMANLGEKASAPTAAAPEPAKAAAAAPAPAAPAAPATAKGERIFASPLARRIAAQNNVDLASLTGSGPRGRIVKADVEGQKGSAAKSTASAAPLASSPSADQVKRAYEGREYEEIALDGMRSTIAARLTESKQTVPHFYLRADIKIDALLSLRAQMNAGLEARGMKVSVNDFIIKAVAIALQQVPAANAVWAGDRVLQQKASDVAVAVAIEGGLFTPVILDAESKSLSTLSAEMKDLATRARDKKLAPHEYVGGSFAISNLGMFGIDNFDAIVNPPHAGILAVGAGKKKPVVLEDGSLGTATVMSVTMSVDHRTVDGALGAELLNAIVANLESPAAMLA